MPINMSIEYQKLQEENMNLRMINDSLLSALKGLTKEITQPGYPLHSGMTIIWLDKARAAIKQAEEL